MNPFIELTDKITGHRFTCNINQVVLFHDDGSRGCVIAFGPAFCRQVKETYAEVYGMVFGYAEKYRANAGAK
jgi:hypothetical protein